MSYYFICRTIYLNIGKETGSPKIVHSKWPVVEDRFGPLRAYVFKEKLVHYDGTFGETCIAVLICKTNG